MKVLVDTSAWVEFLNEQGSETGQRVREVVAGDDEICTCGVVVAELLQGLRSDRSRRHVEEMLGQMTFLEAVGLSSYVRAAALYRSLRHRGVTVRSSIDCLVAVLAEENGCAVLARDRDLTAVLSSGLVAVRAFPTGH